MITRKEIVAANKQYRAENPRTYWPHISPERVIEKTRWLRGEIGECSTSQEYKEMLHSVGSIIVNDSRNW